MLIHLENISKSYAQSSTELFALNQIELDIERHQMTAIIGKSGCGKSTLINILAGLCMPTEGAYYFEGKFVDFSEKPLSHFRRDNIGIIVQNYALINDKTVFDNIALSLHSKKTPTKQVKERVYSFASQMGIESKLRRYPYQLSGGEMQRVAIARALIGSPKLILADEPTGSLDSENSAHILKGLRKIVKTGTTIVLVTHDMDIANSCDRIIKMKDGRIDNT